MNRSASFSAATARPLALANWLFAVAAFVFVMVVVGGITRLTESGLSITQWDLVTGTLPPLTEAKWQSEFALYRETTEYIEVNGPAGMDLAQFKHIYFWEWFHRFLARMVGVVFALPLVWFWVKKAIPKGYKPRLLALLALGASQGALGWYMVQSGLIGRTDVSHFRLSMHLLTALFILAGLVWTALDLRRLAARRRRATLQTFALPVAIVLFVQLLLGAWVAGLNAGYITTEWPLMNDAFWPAGIDWARGAWFALTHDPYLIHWLHRWFAFAALGALIMLAIRVKPRDRRASSALHATVGIQMLLGIATVLSGMNIVLAVLHQANGALLVASVAWSAHVLGRRA
ncbi:COX15/CtaA family protein [Sphingomicrobium sp. XHP0239]|uniref:COX15/CtaA family protein n=1 Tax=Sphingomicrobium maritimum TaxID=3133972 RepID=UPI0031CCD8F2